MLYKAMRRIRKCLVVQTGNTHLYINYGCVRRQEAYGRGTNSSRFVWLRSEPFQGFYFIKFQNVFYFIQFEFVCLFYVLFS